MPNSVKIAIVCVVSIAVIIAAFAFGGRYHVTTIRQAGSEGYIIMADRFTGAAYGCTGGKCWRIRYRTD